MRKQMIVLVKQTKGAVAKVAHLWLPRYMLLVMQSAGVREQIEGPIRTTSGVKNINSKEILRLRFPLPPVDEQLRILSRIEELRSLTKHLRGRLTNSLDLQSRLAEALVADMVKFDNVAVSSDCQAL